MIHRCSSLFPHKQYPYRPLLGMGLAIFGTSNYSDPHWTPDPNTRGTWSLIQTCVITLGLCVYSALHLNVFHHQCRWWMRGLIRCKWMVIALLAPEFIVYNAWSQRRQAVRTAKLLRKRSGQEEPGSFMTTLYRHFKTQAPELDQEKGTQQIQHQEQLLNKNSTSQKDGIKAQVTAKVRSRPVQYLHLYLTCIGFTIYPENRPREVRHYTRICDRHGRTRGRYGAGQTKSVARMV